MARIVIIGAGLTGLSTAYHLEQAGFYDYALFEKENTIGGLCRTINHAGFSFDYTGHLLHCNNPYMRSLLNNILPKNILGTVQRKSYVYSHNTYTHYPYQSSLYGLPTNIIVECIQGFIARKKHSKKPKKFVSWIKQNFGNGIAQNFFLPYQEKIFSYPPEKLTSSWIGRFVPNTTLEEILAGALEPRTQDVGYNAVFEYPQKGGINTLVTAIAQQLHTKIQTNHNLIELNKQKKYVTFSSGHREYYETLISTAPLKELLKITNEPCHKKLLCASVINTNLCIDKKAQKFINTTTNKHWAYLPEKKYQCYRVGFPHAIMPSTCPPDYASMYTELSLLQDNPLNRPSKNNGTIIQEMRSIFDLKKEDIITQKTLYLPYAYVIYNQWRDRNVPLLLKKLQKEDIYSIGRFGGWKYGSMQEAILEGKACAQKLISNMNTFPHKVCSHKQIQQKESIV